MTALLNASLIMVRERLQLGTQARGKTDDVLASWIFIKCCLCYWRHQVAGPNGTFISLFVKAELLFLVLILLTVASKRPILGYCDDNVGLAALQEH